MATIPGSWAGMIPFFPVNRCGCWIYSLPTLTNASTGPEDWALTHTTSVDHNQTDFPRFSDRYLVNGPGSTEFSWECIRQPNCTGYTSTFEIFDIPSSVPAAMLAYLNTYATTTSPGPYSAYAYWDLWWAGVYVEIQIVCFYYWPLAIAPYPTYQFSTNWRLVDDGLVGTPDFAFVPYNYVIGTENTMTGINHPLAGVYTVTDAELCTGRVWLQAASTVAAVDDVIGQLTFRNPGCAEDCATWIYAFPELANQGDVPNYPLVETVDVHDGWGSPFSPTPYTQRTYNVYPPGGGSDFFYSEDPPICSQVRTTITIKQIPGSVVAALTAFTAAAGDAVGSVSSYWGVVGWRLSVNGFLVNVVLSCYSNFEGTVFDPLPRSITYNTYWYFRSPDGTVITDSVAGVTAHPFPGTYSDTQTYMPDGLGYTYVSSPNGGIATMEDLFGTFSIETFDLAPPF